MYWCHSKEHSSHSLSNFKYFSFLKESPQEWNGQLAEAATSILQQHAMQGDLTELQVL